MEAKKKVTSKKPVNKKQSGSTICGAMSLLGVCPNRKNQPKSQVYIHKK